MIRKKYLTTKPSHAPSSKFVFQKMSEQLVVLSEDCHFECVAAIFYSTTGDGEKATEKK